MAHDGFSPLEAFQAGESVGQVMKDLAAERDAALKEVNRLRCVYIAAVNDQDIYPDSLLVALSPDEARLLAVLLTNYTENTDASLVYRLMRVADPETAEEGTKET